MGYQVIWATKSLQASDGLPSQMGYQVRWATKSLQASDDPSIRCLVVWLPRVQLANDAIPKQCRV